MLDAKHMLVYFQRFFFLSSWDRMDLLFFGKTKGLRNPTQAPGATEHRAVALRRSCGRSRMPRRSSREKPWRRGCGGRGRLFFFPWSEKSKGKDPRKLVTSVNNVNIRPKSSDEKELKCHFVTLRLLNLSWPKFGLVNLKGLKNQVLQTLVDLHLWTMGGH